MSDQLTKNIHDKVFGYIKGDISITELYDWANKMQEFAEPLTHVKNKSDVIFFLINQGELETRNFYTDEMLTIKKAGIIKNIKRAIGKEITTEELYNWADDVWNWDLVEGYDDEITQAIIEQLADDPERLKLLRMEDFENILWHLEKSMDPDLSISKTNFIFSLPGIREIIFSESNIQEKLERIGKFKNLFALEDFFEELLESIKTLLTSSSLLETWEKFFSEVSRNTSPKEFLSAKNH